jgi:hypothetical protein
VDYNPYLITTSGVQISSSSFSSPTNPAVLIAAPIFTLPPQNTVSSSMITPICQPTVRETPFQFSYGQTHLYSPPSSSLPSLEERDIYMVLACDGVWDVLSNEDVTGLIMEACNVSHTIDIEEINRADSLFNTAMREGFEMVDNDEVSSDPESSGASCDNSHSEEDLEKIEVKKYEKYLVSSKKKRKGQHKVIKRRNVASIPPVPSAADIANRIRTVALALGSRDNITVLVLKL